VQIIAVEPEKSPVLSAQPGPIKSKDRPPFFCPAVFMEVVDEIIKVKEEDAA